MTDNDAHRMDLNGVRNAAPRGNEPADGWVDADEDQALLRTLHQAVALHYPVPDPDAAWQQVMARRARTASPASTPTRVYGERPRLLPVTIAPHDIVLDQFPASGRRSWLSRWRSKMVVMALAAVVVLGLLGSMRELVTWPPSLPQPGEGVATLEAVSADQKVQALDPEVILARLGPGWSLQSSWSGVADVHAPEATGILGSTRLGFGGPDGARLTVLVLPVATDHAAPDKVWDWTTEDVAIAAENNLDLTTMATSIEGEPAAVPGCRQAIHTQGGSRADWDYTVGITLCAVNTSETILITTSGEVLGNEGWSASDRLATVVAKELADASIVPTHRFEHRGTTESGLYQHALIDAPLVQPLAQGTLLRWTGDVASSPAQASKTPWLKMRTADGVEGWVPGDYLVPAIEGWLPEGYISATPVPE